MSLRTPLYQQHCDLGARMAPFGGWDMPLNYAGVLKEHAHVRTRCGVFDVSHMGEFFVRGPQAAAFLQLCTLTTSTNSRSDKANIAPCSTKPADSSTT